MSQKCYVGDIICNVGERSGLKRGVMSWAADSVMEALSNHLCLKDQKSRTVLYSMNRALAVGRYIALKFQVQRWS
jgi:hypothetical protein